MARVKLENVYKVYEGGVRAVNDFNLDIPDKEFVVFVGPSGCGKSTTLRMIAGLEDITQGKLYIDDEVVNDVESKNRDIAMVFQNYALYPHMTVFQNMAFGLKLRHTPKEEIEKRVKKAAEILEISELLTRKPKALSGGQRQRVALGRAIVREPKVFLLDEPLSNLDAKLRVQMRSEITKLHEKLKTTFIYVTHDQTEAMTMGTRIVVMKDGFIQQVDSPVALYKDPTNLFVATFLGSPQMNILNAKLDLSKGVLSATLYEAENKPVLLFSEKKTKQLINNSYIGKEVKFGIRPEAIKVDEKGNIEGIIDVVEQLGDETIYYCSIPGIAKNLVVKAPFKGRVKSKEKIRLSFDMNSAYLFDADTTNSILGMRTYNNFSVKFDENSIQIGKHKLPLPEELKNKVLPSAFGKKIQLLAEVNEISLEPIENAIKLPIKMEFTEDKTDYVAAFFKVDGLEEHFVMKLKLDSLNKIDNIYLPLRNIKVLDENGEFIKSREVIYPNISKGKVSRSEDKLYVHAFGSKFEVEDKPEYKDLGEECMVELLPEYAKALFTNRYVKGKKQEAKQKSKERRKLEKPVKGEPKKDYLDPAVAARANEEKVGALNTISFEAYDEDKLNKKAFIYGKVKGIDENYATFYVDNDFSVYAMDKFKVYIPKEGVILKKI